METTLKKVWIFVLGLVIFLGGCTTSGIHLYDVRFLGIVQESSILQQPIKDVSIFSLDGELLGVTDSEGTFAIEVSPIKGIATIQFTHPDYQIKTEEIPIDGSYQRTVQLPPLVLEPAGEQVTGRVNRLIVIPKIQSSSSFPVDALTEMPELESQIIFGEYNLVTNQERAWLVEKLQGYGQIIYESKDGFYTIKFDSEEESRELIEELANSAEIEFITQNRLVQAMSIEVKDELWSDLWNMQMLDLPLAWDYSQGEGVMVAVIDSLYTSSHPDLLPNLLPALNVTDNTEEDLDLNRHGLHVAGIIGAQLNNIGVVGVAPNVSILPIRAFGTDTGTINDIVAAIFLAIENGAHVINMSFGTYDKYNPGNDFPDLYHAIKAAYDAGIVLVASSGNYYHDYILYPAKYPEVIGVGAVDADKEKVGYSQYGEGIELMAPGGDYDQGILSTGYDEIKEEYFYRSMIGTSMAAPHVSGLAALLIANGISDPDYIRQILRDTAIDLGEPGYDFQTGYGLIDPYNALDQFQHTYVFFGEVGEGHAQIRSQVIRVEVNGEYQISGVHSGIGRVIGWIDINDNLIIDSGDYLGQSDELTVTQGIGTISNINFELERIAGDFNAIEIGVD